MKPSAPPRDPKFRDPTTLPFLEERNGQVIAHLFSYSDARRVQVNVDGEFSQHAGAWLPPGEQHVAWYFMWSTDPGKDGRHDVLRSLVEPWFKREAIATMTPRIRGFATSLRRQIVENGTGEFDLAREFAYRLSVQTICALVGIPLERESWLRRELQVAAESPSVTAMEIRHNLESYFWETVAKRLVKPQGELLDVLISGWAEGQISDRELLGFIFGFAAAGTDTTGTAIVNAFALSSEFGELDYLRSHLDDDHAIAVAVEEVIRYAPPFPELQQAFTVTPAAFGTIEIPPYAQVLVHYEAANRSPEVNGNNAAARDAREFDLRRWPNHHQGFGVGIHHCLGAALARLEIAVAWRELLSYLPGLSLDESKPFERFTGIVDGVERAPFVFDQQAAERLIDA